jgi:hypothetical protein
MVISQTVRNEPVKDRMDPHAVSDITERISMEPSIGIAKRNISALPGIKPRFCVRCSIYVTKYKEIQ